MKNEINKILICDDDGMNRTIISRAIKSDTRIVVEASNGNEALEILKAHNDISLILMDIQMPGISGFDTVKIIKENPELQNIPVIFISGIYKSDANVNMGYEIGAYDYIFKPFEFKELRNKTEIFLKLFNQQKKLEQIAKTETNQKEFLSKILTTIPSLLFVLDLSKKIINTNYDIVKSSGDYSIFSVNEFLAPLKNDVDEIINTGNQFERELELESVDGNKTGYFNVLLNIIKENNNTENILISINDITKQKIVGMELIHSVQVNKILNTILKISIEHFSSETTFDKILEQILSIPWLNLENKGCIFIVEDEPDKLQMRANKNLDICIRNDCSQVNFGDCLCGKAAVTKEIIFADEINHLHTYKNSDSAPHGHYIVPIVSENITLGLINLYLKEGYKQKDGELEFLNIISQLMAGIIQRKRIEDELLKNERNQTVFNYLLQTSLEDISLENILEKFLHKIISLEWLNLQSKGVIFLVENNSENLVMKAQLNLNANIQELCSTVPFGKCLCGQAAKTKERIFKNCLDEDHHINYPKMLDHGHYVIPIVYENVTLGVICLYLQSGQKYKKQEEEFLVSVANLLVMIIKKKHSDKAFLDNESKFKVIYENSNDALMLLNDKGFFDCNLRTLEVFGFENKSEFINTHPGELSPPFQPDGKDSRVAANEQIAVAFEKGSNFFEWIHCRKNGVPFFADVTLSAFVFEGDNVIQATVRDITERKQNENALRESESKLTAITNSAQDAIITLNSKGMISFWNNSAEKIFGYSSTEAIGKNLHMLLAPSKYHSTHKNEFPKWQSTGEGVAIGKTLELTALRKNGEEFVVEISLSSVKLDGSWSAIGILRDISERKKTEELLEKNEAKYRLLFESSTDAIIILNPPFWEINSANKSAELLFGFDSGMRLLNHNLMDVSPIKQPDGDNSSEKLIDYYEITLDKGIVNFEWTFISSSRGLFLGWVQFITIEIEGVTGILCTARDISNIRKFEQSMIKDQFLLNEAQKIGDLGSWEYDVEKHSFEWSENMYKIFEIDKKIVKKIKFDYFINELIHPDDTETVLNVFKNILSERNKNEVDYKIKCQGENIKFIHSKLKFMYDNQRNSNIIIGFVQDVTQRIKIENQRSLSMKMESVGQLASGIAHEINTPLQFVGDNTYFINDAFNTIVNYTKELESSSAIKDNDSKIDELKSKFDIDYLFEEVPIALERSQNGIERVTKIVQAMKSFAHPSQKQKTLSNINQSLDVTITISRNEWKYIAELVTELNEDIPLVYCSIEEINQVILNMIINASHAIADVLPQNSSEKGLITIKTNCDSKYVKIFISDTGAGIPKERIHRIWEPFYTTKEVGKGTGQGLAIAHDIIVNKHGGEILVDSIVGQGTTFTIKLPIN